MTILSCSTYHISLKALVYKEGHHARLDQIDKALDMSEKTPLTSSEGLRSEASNDL